jgi:CRISPR-associated protein Csx3
MAKIAVGGPPHSGKSVLISVLRSLLPREKYVIVEGAPDGEGITGWAHEADPELVRAVRRKGKFLEEFMEWVVDSVRNSRMPIILVDLGGMLVAEDGSFSPTGQRLTSQNERIVRECDGIIVIANPDYAEVAARWLAEAERLGVKPIAILESILEGAEDEVYEAGPPLRARITRLERECPPVGSAIARALADLLLELAGEGTGADGSAEADVNFPRLAEALNLPVRNGGPDRDWFPGILPPLVAFVAAATTDREVVNLWGNCPAGFPYHALACGLPQRVRYFDPKVGGYVALPEVEPSGEGSQVLDWRVEDRDDYSFVEFVIPLQIFDVAKLPMVIPPAVPTHKGVVLSGKGPWWLTGTICRAYHRAGVLWVAVFTPQESSRHDSEGRKWSECFPGLAPAVVVASRDATVPAERSSHSGSSDRGFRGRQCWVPVCPLLSEPRNLFWVEKGGILTSGEEILFFPECCL